MPWRLGVVSLGDVARYERARYWKDVFLLGAPQLQTEVGTLIPTTLRASIKASGGNVDKVVKVLAGARAVQQCFYELGTGVKKFGRTDTGRVTDAGARIHRALGDSLRSFGRAAAQWKAAGRAGDAEILGLGIEKLKGELTLQKEIHRSMKQFLVGRTKPEKIHLRLAARSLAVVLPQSRQRRRLMAGLMVHARLFENLRGRGAWCAPWNTHLADAARCRNAPPVCVAGRCRRAELYLAEILRRPV